MLDTNQKANNLFLAKGSHKNLNVYFLPISYFDILKKNRKQCHDFVVEAKTKRCEKTLQRCYRFSYEFRRSRGVLKKSIQR